MFSKLTAATFVGAASANFNFFDMPPMPMEQNHEMMEQFPKFEQDFNLFPKMEMPKFPSFFDMDKFPRFDQMPNIFDQGFSVPSDEGFKCPVAAFFENIFGDEEPQCELSEADTLGDWEYTRLQMQGAMQASFRGMYHSRKEIVSDECFGEWMNDYVDDFTTAFDALQEDPFSISITDAKKYGSRMLDAIYKNADACQLTRLNDESNKWCMDNLGICAGDDFDWFSNVMEYGVPLAGEAFDLFKLVFWENDACYTDKEYIDEINRSVEDVTSIISYIFGFNVKWNPDAQIEHITQGQLDDAIENYWDQQEPMDDDMDFEDEGFFLA
mmetsp:Transcript_7449/g.11634  ORF Transcript_7449/g.11634 Transcript_7449/m.11634 type:complete len:326 (-) Transcript_7449:103-1080(-)